MNTRLPDLRARATRAFAWSAVQSWSVKALSLGVFLVLARYLQPAELGLAQGVMLLLAFVAVLAAQGFQPALVQRPVLHRDDVNLPFFVSLATALIASAVLLLLADPIAARIGDAAAAPLVRLAALIPPLAAGSSILIAMSRRELDFGRIARATLVASLAAGAAALLLAIGGHGATSLVVQAVIAAAVSAALLWHRPVWRPRWRLRPARFRALLSYSSMAFASQLLDFFAWRFIDFVILARHGLAALGTYTVGAKLYLTILELLASALVEPALSALSRIAGDGGRLRQAYLRLVFLAGCSTLPLFVGAAALAPELCALLFGQRWSGAESVAHWLCLLGAVQAVQFFNSAALGATGHAQAVLTINAAKLVAAAGALVWVEATSVGQLALAYVVAQLAVTPLSFAATLRFTGTPLAALLQQLRPGLLGAALGYAAVLAARPWVAQQVDGVGRAALLAALFALAAGGAIALQCPRRLMFELRGIAAGAAR